MTARAAIDIGSNAARLLVADGGQPVLRRSRITDAGRAALAELILRG